MASEEMSFENVDRWTTDGQQMDDGWTPAYTISSPIAKKSTVIRITTCYYNN